MSNNTQLSTEQGEAFDIPEDGSLGLLALGYVGLMLWREKRQEVFRSKQVGVQASDAFEASDA